MDNFLLTAQEHQLFFSGIPDKYTSRPHTPIHVIDGTISVEECNELRQGESKLDGIMGSYWGLNFASCSMTIEPLDTESGSETYGQTARDPVLIRTSFPHEMQDLSDEFPYRRDGPVVRLEDE
jgi:hypothetical protein